MTMHIIKVINQNNKHGSKKMVAVLNGAYLEHHDRRTTAGIVNDWISECRENSRVERIFSGYKISAWQTLPPVLTETFV